MPGTNESTLYVSLLKTLNSKSICFEATPVALKASNFAKEGKEHPIPGTHCQFCNVSRICGLGLEKRGNF